MKIGKKKTFEKLSRNDYLAFTSILISILVFIFAWYTYHDQNKKWDDLNLGNITVKEVRFSYFREVTAKELNTLHWGYPGKVITDPDNKVMQTGKYIVQNCLIARDLRSNQIYGDESSITIDELKKELAQLNILQDTGYFQLEKKYYVNIRLENIGPTQCYITNETISVKMSSKDNDFENVQLPESKMTLDSKKESTTQFPFSLFVLQNLPDPFEINYVITYKDINQNFHSRKFQFLYSKGTWQVINS